MADEAEAEEYRVDPEDPEQHPYTLSEFVEEYGGSTASPPEQWLKAKPWVPDRRPAWAVCIYIHSLARHRSDPTDSRLALCVLISLCVPPEGGGGVLVRSEKSRRLTHRRIPRHVLPYCTG